MDMDRGCPGSDRSTWTPDDIFEALCIGCGEPVEFFKVDARRYCAKCGARNPNPRQDVGCAAADKRSRGRNALGGG